MTVNNTYLEATGRLSAGTNRLSSEPPFSCRLNSTTQLANTVETTELQAFSKTYKILRGNSGNQKHFSRHKLNGWGQLR